MVTKTAKFEKERGLWAPVITLTPQQEKTLRSICDAPEFVEGVKQIAQNFAAALQLRNQLIDEAEIKPTLQKYVDQVRALKVNTANLPGRVHAPLSYQLYSFLNDSKWADRLKELEHILQNIETAGSIAIKKLPEQDRGPKARSGYAIEAATALAQLFARFNLKYSYVIQSPSPEGVALSCLRIIMNLSGREPLSESTIANYAKQGKAAWIKSTTLKGNYDP